MTMTLSTNQTGKMPQSLKKITTTIPCHTYQYIKAKGLQYNDIITNAVESMRLSEMKTVSGVNSGVCAPKVNGLILSDIESIQKISNHGKETFQKFNTDFSDGDRASILIDMFREVLTPIVRDSFSEGFDKDNQHIAGMRDENLRVSKNNRNRGLNCHNNNDSNLFPHPNTDNVLSKHLKVMISTKSTPNNTQITINFSPDGGMSVSLPEGKICDPDTMRSLSELQNGLLDNIKRRPSGIMTISEYMNDAKIEEAFKSYCRRTGVKTEGMIKTYIREMSRIKPVVKPDDLYDYRAKYGKPLTAPQRNAILKFFNFIFDVKNLKQFNDFEIEGFRRALKNTEKSTARREESRTRDLTAEELRAGRDRIENDDVRKLYTIIYYSGARLEQMRRILESSKKLDIEFIKSESFEADGEQGGDIIRIDGSSAQLGDHKQCLDIYLPACCEKYVRGFKTGKYAFSSAGKKMRQCGTEGRNINAASLRKASYNALIRDLDINQRDADFIQSRTSNLSIGDIHYADQRGLATKAYQKAVNHFLDVLPWDWD